MSKRGHWWSINAGFLAVGLVLGVACAVNPPLPREFTQTELANVKGGQYSSVRVVDNPPGKDQCDVVSHTPPLNGQPVNNDSATCDATPNATGHCTGCNATTMTYGVKQHCEGKTSGCSASWQTIPDSYCTDKGLTVKKECDGTIGVSPQITCEDYTHMAPTACGSIKCMYQRS
jgi:hypothetical protein